MFTFVLRYMYQNFSYSQRRERAKPLTLSVETIHPLANGVNLGERQKGSLKFKRSGFGINMSCFISRIYVLSL